MVADAWMRLEHSPPELYAETETFEKQQLRDFLTQLLARPSALYRQAAISGLSPAAFRLECWKRLAEIQGVTRRALAATKLENALDVKNSIET
ncbi:TPA: hypothetical protein ACH3X2_001992 [Trebouxia sp. C0005]